MNIVRFGIIGLLVVSLWPAQLVMANDTPTLQSGQIVVTLSGYTPSNDSLIVMLTNEKDQFIQANTPAYKEITLSSTQPTSTVQFDDIPFGEYAVKAFQDKNNSKKLDVILGFPQEPTGYSMVDTGILPPPFKKAKFTHQNAVTPIHVLIRRHFK